MIRSIVTIAALAALLASSCAAIQRQPEFSRVETTDPGDAHVKYFEEIRASAGLGSPSGECGVR